MISYFKIKQMLFSEAFIAERLHKILVREKREKTRRDGSMCDYWKDYGFDDGGERCKLNGQKTLCSADKKDCSYPKELRKKGE